MITKKQLIDSLVHECNIVKHLHSKLKPEHFDYRPAANMRSTLEVLQYLTVCGIISAKAMATGNWDLGKIYSEQSAKLLATEIPLALDRQATELKEVINEFTDQDLLHKEVKFPWGVSDILGSGLVNTSLKFLTAYRMQLFVYAKSAGLSELNTGNCWMGFDFKMPPKN